jgi:hypothetical protein
MKGFMQSAFAAVCAAGALGSIGCTGGERYRNLIDPCRQERYSAMARQEVITSFTPQVMNGRILDQTIWNHDFEAGSDKLHPKGMDKLDQIVRRRPEPDPRVFIATARDVGYNPEKAVEFADARRDLDAKRAAAIQKYLGAQTAGRPMTFEVLIHDPAEPGLAGVSARAGVLVQRSNYTGALGGGGGGAAMASTSISSSGVTVGNQPPAGQGGTQAGSGSYSGPSSAPPPR